MQEGREIKKRMIARFFEPFSLQNVITLMVAFYRHIFSAFISYILKKLDEIKSA